MSTTRFKPNIGTRARGNRAPVGQRGSILVMAGVFLLFTGILLLWGIQVGYAFYIKRELQKAVDVAALSGAQIYSSGALDECGPVEQAASASFTANAASLGAVTLTPKCGLWVAPAATPAAGDPVDHMYTLPLPSHLEGALLNAVRVEASHEVSGFIPFMGDTTVYARATAQRDDPVAAFSVGSQLLRTNGAAPLMRLGKLVGVDLSQTTIGDASGLANVKITPAGLLSALGLDTSVDLGVGRPTSLVDAGKVQVGQLIAAMAQVVGQGTAAAATISSIGTELVKANLDKVELNLFGTSAASGLFGQVTNQIKDAALNVNLDALGLLSTSIAIAAQGRAVSVPGLDVLGVNVKAGVVEPPSIGIGGIGTRAYNAQVRLYIDIDTRNIPLVNGLFEALQTRLHIPLYIDVINGYGTLEALQCNTEPRTATIKVSSSILRACAGELTDNSIMFSTSALCESALNPATTFIKLLGASLTSTPLQVNALEYTSDPDLTFSVSKTTQLPMTQSTAANPLAVGTTLSDLGGSLTDVLDSMFSTSTVSSSQAASDLALQYLEETKRSTGFYDVTVAANLAKNGGTIKGATVDPLGDWIVDDGIPYACVLGLGTCWKDGSVWESLTKTTLGQGQGLVGGVLGVLGVSNCTGILSALNYNNCVKNNLASYLKNSPNGIIDSGGPATTNHGLLYTLLSPAVNILRPLLDDLGSVLSSLLQNVLGLELGRTDVTLLGLGCGNVKLVY